MNNLKLRKKNELLRGGPNFDPVKYVKEVSHVEHMHADSILIHPNFSSKLMIMWLKPTFDPFSNSLLTHDHELFENSLLVHLH